VLLGFISMPGRLVMDAHPRYGDFRPRQAELSMDRREVLKVDAVFNELE
jgi:hypothetical protein